MIRDAIVLVPDIGVVEPIRKPPHVRFPVADEEVKVVRAVALRQICRIRRRLRVKRDSESHAQNERHQGFEFAEIHSNFILSRPLVRGRW